MLSNLIEDIQTDWKDILLKIIDENKDDYNTLNNFLLNEITLFNRNPDIFPPDKLIFAAFNKFNIDSLKVIIIGQDPYHQKNQAMGLSFSVPDCVKIPPSLRNIYKELKNDLLSKNINKNDYDINMNINININNEFFNNGELTLWAEQGVLLLNTALTVRESKPNSHSKVWQFLTLNIIKYITEHTENKIFMLWGNNAKSIKKNINTKYIDNHYFLEASHPSPLSANRGGWFGNNHFTKTNTILEKLNKDKIRWT